MRRNKIHGGSLTSTTPSATTKSLSLPSTPTISPLDVMEINSLLDQSSDQQSAQSQLNMPVRRKSLLLDDNSIDSIVMPTINSAKIFMNRVRIFIILYLCLFLINLLKKLIFFCQICLFYIFLYIIFFPSYFAYILFKFYF